MLVYYIKVSRRVMDSHLTATQSSLLSHIQVLVRQVFQEPLVQRVKRVVRAHQVMALKVPLATVDSLDLLAFLDLLAHPVSSQIEQKIISPLHSRTGWKNLKSINIFNIITAK